MDARSQHCYGHFGDVIVFDTAFNTNVYVIMFTLLLGVNNHGQTTTLGYTFFKNEKRDLSGCSNNSLSYAGIAAKSHSYGSRWSYSKGDL